MGQPGFGAKAITVAKKWFDDQETSKSFRDLLAAQLYGAFSTRDMISLTLTIPLSPESLRLGVDLSLYNGNVYPSTERCRIIR